MISITLTKHDIELITDALIRQAQGAFERGDQELADSSRELSLRIGVEVARNELVAELLLGSK